MIKLILETLYRDDFDSTAKKAKSIAIKCEDVIVEFDFNGTKCLVNANTNLNYLYRDYLNSPTMNWKVVGPNPIENYSKEISEELNKKGKEISNELERNYKQHTQQIEKEKAAFENKVKDIILEVKDINAWNEFCNKNSLNSYYNKNVLDFAKGWGKLMQIEIKNGKKIEEIADYTSHQLSFIDMTGFMFNCSLKILISHWRYGEALRLFYNKKYNYTGLNIFNK